jgi:hypothetical protein
MVCDEGSTQPASQPERCPRLPRSLCRSRLQGRQHQPQGKRHPLRAQGSGFCEPDLDAAVGEAMAASREMIAKEVKANDLSGTKCAFETRLASSSA